MVTAFLFTSLLSMILVGVPVAAALGLAGTLAISLAGLGLQAIPASVLSGIAKYPLLAIPMFVFAGTVFERAGVAARLVRFATAIVGTGPGALAVVAIAVAMMMGGISGSGAAITATVATVMVPTMVKNGYPRPFIATVVAAGAATDILIPPSIVLIIYSVLVPAASVPAIFAAGIVPGTLAGFALLVPAWFLARRHGFGGKENRSTRPPFWSSFYDAFWGLFAKVIILGGLRFGIFTPTEAAVVALAYGMLLGLVIYRSIKLPDLYQIAVDAAELSGIILILIACASVFAWAVSSLSLVDPILHQLLALDLNQYVVLAAIIVILIVAGIFLEGVSAFLILVPLLMPIANLFKWNPVWFGIILTLKVAVGSFTPPLAVNLMVSSKIAGCSVEKTVVWVGWFILAMFLTLLLVAALPELALWLPRTLGIRVD